MGLILYFSILIIGAPFTIDINAYGNHPIFSLGNVSHLVYAQGGSDKMIAAAIAIRVIAAAIAIRVILTQTWELKRIVIIAHLNP